MVIVTGLEKVMSLDVRGNFGYSGGFGLIALGWCSFGFYNEYSGIYSRKKLAKGWGVSRMRFYGPTNPQTSTQQAWRTIFANGMSAWRSLTTEEKELLSNQARIYRLTGTQLFMKRYLQQHRA